MNSSLHQSLQDAIPQHSSYDTQQESFFEEAKQNLIKDLVDFQNRDDFDQYMRTIEKNYYVQANVQKPPYEMFPEFPPKPFQSYKSIFTIVLTLEIEQHIQESSRKDYIDKVNDLNQKRQTTFSQSAYQQQQQFQNHQNTYIHQQNPAYVTPYQTPFFDTVVNKENFLSTFSHPQQSHQLPLGMPYSGPVPHGNIPQGFLGDKYGQVMEPHRMVQQQPPYMQKFVAGPLRLEQNPLSEPSRNFNPTAPPQHLETQNNFDLKNPDSQYERYKQLMSSQYYNNHANSAHAGSDLTGQRQVYMPPAPFNYTQQPPPMHPQGMNPQHQQDIYNMSFAPHMQQTMPQVPQVVHPQSYQQSNVYPNTQQIYHGPNGVSMYQQPQVHHSIQHPPVPLVRPEVYSSIKYQNNVTKDVIESIGGIQDTLKPMQDTLKQHELRPYQVYKDYRKELYYSQHGRPLKRSSSEVKPENMHLVSVSPFRAVVKVKDDKRGDDSEEELQRYDTETDDRMRATLSESRRRNESPFRQDSELIRGQREEFLNTFSSKRHSGQHLQKNNQKIQSESEFMRSQREQFLNGFSGENDLGHNKPPLPQSHRGFMPSPNLQIQV